MKFLPLIWSGLWRKPARTLLTAASIVIAFLLIGLLQGVNAGFDAAIAKARKSSSSCSRGTRTIRWDSRSCASSAAAANLSSS